jgi:hypothetical protein
VAAPDDAGVEVAPPRPENREGPPAVAVVAPVPEVVVVAPLAAGVVLGVVVAGFPKLKRELPPVDAAVLDPAPANKLEAGAAEDAGAAAVPPREKDGMLDGGWDDAGAAGVVPRLNVGGLLAGVAEGVALVCSPNSGGFA